MRRFRAGRVLRLRRHCRVVLRMRVFMHRIVRTSSSRAPQYQVKHESFLIVAWPSNMPVLRNVNGLLSQFTKKIPLADFVTCPTSRRKHSAIKTGIVSILSLASCNGLRNLEKLRCSHVLRRHFVCVALGNKTIIRLLNTNAPRDAMACHSAMISCTWNTKQPC